MAALLDLSRKRDAHIDQRLREDLIIWFTSVRPDGRPHAVAVWFLWDGETILVFSQPANQKVYNLQQNAHVLLAIDNTHDGEDPITIEGTAELLAPGTLAPTIPAYAQKYAQGLKDLGFTAEKMGETYSQAIRVTPTRAR